MTETGPTSVRESREREREGEGEGEGNGRLPLSLGTSTIFVSSLGPGWMRSHALSFLVGFISICSAVREDQ
jgi:hypothetical protein